MGGERMAQRVHGGRLGDAGGTDRRLEVPLQALLVEVMAAARQRPLLLTAASRIGAQPGRREEPEPGPAFRGTLVLGGEGVRQVDAGAVLPLLVKQPEATGLLELLAQGPIERARQHDDAILATLAVAHDDDLAN